MGQRQKKINWVKYNRELVQRGSATFWISEDALANWFYIGVGSGFQRIYSDIAILAILILFENQDTEAFVKCNLLNLMKTPSAL